MRIRHFQNCALVPYFTKYTSNTQCYKNSAIIFTTNHFYRTFKNDVHFFANLFLKLTIDILMCHAWECRCCGTPPPLLFIFPPSVLYTELFIKLYMYVTPSQVGLELFLVLKIWFFLELHPPHHHWMSCFIAAKIPQVFISTCDDF